MSLKDLHTKAGPKNMNRALKAGICVVVCLIGICCVGVVLLLMEMIVEDHKAQLRDNEVLTQHLGDVQSFELDWGELEFSKAEHMVFNVAGTKRSGVVTVKSMTVLDA